MRINKWWLLFLIALIISPAYGESLEFEPEWLQGRIAIDLYGDDRELGAWPYERYICIFNLDNDQIDTLKIPDSSMVIREWGSGGRVAFVYPYTDGYYCTDENFTSPRWGEYGCTKIVPTETEEGTIYRRGVMVSDFLNYDNAADESVISDTIWMPSSLQVLGLSKSDSFGYGNVKDGLYLAYGVSEENQIELQLQRFEEEGCSILYHFPIDYGFDRWQYAISPIGDIAWWNKRDELMCIKGDEILTAKEEMYLDKPFTKNNTLAWKNDTELLYFAKTNMENKYVVKKWDISTGTCDYDLDSMGCEISTEFTPWCMAVNDDGDILAIYGTTAKEAGIQFINLKTGENYTMYPWRHENPDERSGVRWYGISDQGIMYYLSCDLLQSQLFWVSD